MDAGPEPTYEEKIRVPHPPGMGIPICATGSVIPHESLFCG